MTFATEQVPTRQPSRPGVICGYQCDWRQGQRSFDLTVMRTIGETIEIPQDAEDHAFERVQLRSPGADAELRNAEGGGLSDREFASRIGVRSRETIRQYRDFLRGCVSAPCLGYECRLPSHFKAVAFLHHSNQ